MLWSKSALSDTAFTLEIQNMAKTSNQKNTNFIQIPLWMKIDAVWWAEGKISDMDFNSSIQYLLDNNIMKA